LDIRGLRRTSWNKGLVETRRIAFALQALCCLKLALRLRPSDHRPSRHGGAPAGVRRRAPSDDRSQREEADIGEDLVVGSAENWPVVKVTLRLPPAHARLIAMRAR